MHRLWDFPREFLRFKNVQGVIDPLGTMKRSIKSLKLVIFIKENFDFAMNLFRYNEAYCVWSELEHSLKNRC